MRILLTVSVSLIVCAGTCSCERKTDEPQHLPAHSQDRNAESCVSNQVQKSSIPTLESIEAIDSTLAYLRIQAQLYRAELHILKGIRTKADVDKARDALKQIARMDQAIRPKHRRYGSASAEGAEAAAMMRYLRELSHLTELISKENSRILRAEGQLFSELIRIEASVAEKADEQ